MESLKNNNREFAREQDAALAEAVGRGDRRAAHRMAERLFSRVRATVLYMAPGHRDADDMIQRALMETLRSAGSYRGECSLERWADRIVSRTVMRIIKGRRKKDFIVSPGAEPDDGWAAGTQEAAVLKARTRKHLAGLLSGLSEKRRVVVVLHWVHGYKVSEIAEMVDAPVNTVRDRLIKGKKILKKRILKDPVLCEWLETVDHE